MDYKEKFNFNDLFIFEMANNHQGSVQHGIRIIEEMGVITKKHNLRAAVKLQFRDLDTFIHPAYIDSKDNKHISRFLSTRLSEEQFASLAHTVKQQGMITMCTPFDEVSVDRIERLGIEIIKIGSCSAQDWPLLERVAAAGKPVVCSTGGLTIKEIDRVVSFFQHRGVHFALMYCVAIYPTPLEKLHLNQIELMKNRYPGVEIGFSTHEDPADSNIIRVAYAKGARLYEKHVGVATDEIKLNAYSATPAQTEAWVVAYEEAKSTCGQEGERVIDQRELDDLNSLMRGVYVNKPLRQGDRITREDVFFAIPLLPNQLSSGLWVEGLLADRDYEASHALQKEVLPKTVSKRNIIYSAIHAIKGMLNSNHIFLSHDFLIELSHHYGLENFHEVGCTIIECFNREYAKKLIIQLPGQWNPIHYHKVKDETFHVLHGILNVEIEGQKRILYPGDTLWVPRGVWHSFSTTTGVVFEEVSTTSVGSDSFYIDRTIASLPREERKTKLNNWGRHQFDTIE